MCNYFHFCDASFGSLRGAGSIESVFVILGRVRSRNGDLSCSGCFIDSSARKISRFCRISLAAESMSLSNSEDLCIWIRALTLEMMLGVFLKELVDPGASFKLLTSFGDAPSLEEVLREVQTETLKVDKIVDLRSDSPAPQPLPMSLFNQTLAQCMVEHWRRLLLMTDSYNCYSSILSGSPKNTEKSINAQLSYVRDISTSLALTFIGKNYNLSDFSTKSAGGNDKLLGTFLHFGTFRIGFIGRKM